LNFPVCAKHVFFVPRKFRFRADYSGRYPPPMSTHSPFYSPLLAPGNFPGQDDHGSGVWQGFPTLPHFATTATVLPTRATSFLFLCEWGLAHTHSSCVHHHIFCLSLDTYPRFFSRSASRFCSALIPPLSDHVTECPIFPPPPSGPTFLDMGFCSFVGMCRALFLTPDCSPPPPR